MSWKWKGQGREGGKREARPHKVRYVKGRDKQFTAASSQRILTQTGQKRDAELLFILAFKGLVRIAYYSRQSLSRSLSKRRRNGTAPKS